MKQFKKGRGKMQIKDLSMSFGTQDVFRNVNLNIPDNEKIGLVGVNGAGKTTLFKIIKGLEYPDSGKIYFKKDARVDWLPQEITMDAKDTSISVLDYLLSGRPIDQLNNELQSVYDSLSNDDTNQQEAFAKIESLQKKLEYWDSYNAESTLLKIIDGLNIGEDILEKKLSEISGGQKSKVAFAKLLYNNPEIILLDEPTNHLDEASKEYVVNFLKHYKGTVLIISHDIEFLDKVTSKTLFLDKRTKTFELYDGNYSKFKKLQLEKEEYLLKQAQIQEKEEKKLREIVNKYANASGNRKRMAQDREKKLEKLLKEKIEVAGPNKNVNFKMDMERETSSIPLQIKNLRFKYDKNSTNYIIDNLNFDLHKGEKFLIVGENGVGKSTLLKLLVGLLKPDEGEININEKTDMGYYAQELEILQTEKNILENFLDTNYNQKQIRNILSKFLFYGDEVFKNVNVLSPGEKSRVALAKLAMCKANLLLLDEPTNHLDPETQRIIAEVFKTYEGTMIVVSHNPEFVDNLGIERLLLLPDGKISYYDRNIVEHYQELNRSIRR